MQEEPDTSEWQKATQHKKEWLAIKDFLKTLQASNAVIAEYQPSYQSAGISTRDRVLKPYAEEEIEYLIADHFGIDLDRVKKEQEAVIEYWAAKNLKRSSEN